MNQNRGMVMYKTRTEYIFCPTINENAAMVFNSFEDKKKGIKLDPIMENCDSADKCGVEDEKGGIDMSRCPFNGRKLSSF